MEKVGCAWRWLDNCWRAPPSSSAELQLCRPVTNLLPLSKRYCTNSHKRAKQGRNTAFGCWVFPQNVRFSRLKCWKDHDWQSSLLAQTLAIYVICLCYRCAVLINYAILSMMMKDLAGKLGSSELVLKINCLLLRTFLHFPPNSILPDVHHHHHHLPQHQHHQHNHQHHCHHQHHYWWKFLHPVPNWILAKFQVCSEWNSTFCQFSLPSRSKHTIWIHYIFQDTILVFTLLQILSEFIDLFSWSIVGIDC